MKGTACNTCNNFDSEILGGEFYYEDCYAPGNIKYKNKFNYSTGEYYQERKILNKPSKINKGNCIWYEQKK